MCLAKRHGGMGFRDMRKFNDSLLAKQVWRLIQNDQSLFCKVFKARFFLHGSILDDDVKINGSYAWKSIIQARSIIQKGALWHIGSRYKAKIWGDNWVPGLTSSHITLERHYFPENAKVANLIDQASNTWKRPLIQHLFNPIEAQKILGLPLSNHATPDKLYWPHTASGTFSVRNAYHLQICSEYISDAQQSRTTVDSTIWHFIWGLNTPPKIRHFLWRACTESFPTRKNLYRWHIPIDPLCSECSQSKEDALHALWGCQVAVNLWAKNTSFQSLQGSSFTSFTDLLVRVSNTMDEKFQMIFAVQAWLLWFRRNKGRVENIWDSVD